MHLDFLHIVTHTTHIKLISSHEQLTIQISVWKLLGQFTLSTQLIKQNYLCLLDPFLYIGTLKYKKIHKVHKSLVWVSVMLILLNFKTFLLTYEIEIISTLSWVRLKIPLVLNNYAIFSIWQPKLEYCSLHSC